jgi:LysR family hydrogen peroxide-inducible transcriptional activator
VTRAAGALHVSQPTISQAIHALEAELGQALFRREPRGMKLTDAGVALRRHALRILHAVADAEEELGSRRQQLRDLQVGVLPTLAHEYLPRLLKRFLDEARREVSVHLIELPTQMLLRQVLSGDLHLAVVDLPLADPGLRVEPLWQEPLVLLSPLDSHLPAGPLPVARLAEEPFITVEPGYGLRDVLFRVALEAGFQPRVAQELTSLRAVIGYVAAGFGVALAPERAVQLEVGAGLVRQHVLDPTPLREIGVIWRAERRLPGLARRFKDYLVAAGPPKLDQRAKSPPT